MSAPGVPTRSPLRSEVDDAIESKEDSGVAAALLAAHVGASDPHAQYAHGSTLATVATTGAYADLTGKPTIPSTPDAVGAQPFDGDLLAIAQIEPQLDDVIQRKNTGWVARSMAQLAADLGIGGGDAVALPTLPLFNVDDYGAVGDGVTDDYLAIREAWDAMLDSPTGGLLFFPRAVVYRVAATTLRLGPTAEKAYALFPLPMLSSEGPLKRTYGVLGVGEPYAVRAASSFGVDGDAQQIETASMLLVDYDTPFAWHATHGHPSVFGAPDADATGHTTDNIVTNLHFVLDGMIIRQPGNPSLANLNRELCSTSRLGSYRADVAPVLDAVPEPTHPTGCADLAPKSNNNVAVPVEFFVAEGYYAGLAYTEHCDVSRAIILRCKIAVHNRRACSHYGHMGMLKLEQCPYQMAGYDPSGAGPNLGVVPWVGGTVVIQFVDVEHYAYEAREDNPAGVAWIYPPVHGCDIYAPNGGLGGSIRAYGRINSEPAPPTGIGVAPFGGGSDIYVLGNVEGGLGMSGFAIYDLLGEGVTVAGGRRHLGTAPSNPVVDPPNTPTIGVATAGVESADVAFTPAVGGAPATSYRAISTPGSITATDTTSPITVGGLTGGIEYTFTVRAQNAIGNSAESAASNAVTPSAAVTLPADDFDRADAASLGVSSSGHTWQGDPENAFAIALGKAVDATAGVAWNPAWLPVGQNDMDVKGSIVHGSMESGIVARLANANDCLYLDWTHDSPTAMSGRIYARTGGGFTPLSDGFAHTVVTGTAYEMRLRCEGDTVQAYIGGVLKATITDPTHSGTNAGIAHLSGPVVTTFDDFSVTEV